MEINLVETLVQNGWQTRKPATPEELAQLKEKFQIDLPADYELLLQFSNGGSLYGFATPFILYSLIEVLALFREHDLYDFLPASLIFGGDGGGTIYTYDLSSQPYRVVFYREKEPADQIIYQGKSLTDILLKVIGNEKMN